MDMFTLTTKILAVQRMAQRQNGALFNARSAGQIVADTQDLLDLVAYGKDRAEMLLAVVTLRGAELWPGDLRGWAWFDERLLTLAEYLAQEETFPSQAELVDELERAIAAGVIR